MSFKEELLHFIWKYKRFDHRDLKTSDDQSIHIVKYGMHNYGSGPDFHDGRVIINETKWAGNIEMHIKASDWHLHKHQTDKAYDNVILHVVYENDTKVVNSKGHEIPTLELKGRIDAALIENYENIISNTKWIPCQDQISSVDSILVNQAIDNALIQRLTRKSEAVLQSLKFYNNDWNKVFFEFLAIGLGAKINKKPFAHLARITPFDLVAKYSDNILLVEALLFGQAGMLGEKSNDEYQEKLKKEYEFLKHKHQFGIEKNSLIKKWLEIGVKKDTAYDSQGLLELKNECCTFKKCLSCPIGVGLLKN